MEPDCDFCLIVHGQTATEILMSDDELVCFRDVKPGAAHHYLIIPRTHIEDCKSLQGKDVPLVERMKEMGQSVLLKNDVKDLEDIRLIRHFLSWDKMARSSEDKQKNPLLLIFLHTYCFEIL
ncbi:adenosine 5'-monophosphoramidase HINT3-like isoform X2 [Synchiropus splendidus]|uniref:adenosine 5'-monophosphoramidase HINT3-like isoform X2 n=1 Tax=Synchiropus splendidus TaxID=270530 RepID=UPI00237D615F|nr:adenosine 5'-monophosphoramidase HINT3-like isoform X2 [Synchiropus splendidus]